MRGVPESTPPVSRRRTRAYAPVHHRNHECWQALTHHWTLCEDVIGCTKRIPAQPSTEERRRNGAERLDQANARSEWGVAICERPSETAQPGTRDADGVVNVSESEDAERRARL